MTPPSFEVVREAILIAQGNYFSPNEHQYAYQSDPSTSDPYPLFVRFKGETGESWGVFPTCFVVLGVYENEIKIAVSDNETRDWAVGWVKGNTEGLKKIEARFKAGDVVQLNGGGCLWTVQACHEHVADIVRDGRDQLIRERVRVEVLKLHTKEVTS